MEETQEGGLIALALFMGATLLPPLVLTLFAQFMTWQQ